MKFFAIIICAVVSGIGGGGGKQVLPERSEKVTIFFIRHAQSKWNLRKGLRAMRTLSEGQEKLLMQQHEEDVKGNLANNERDVGLTSEGIEEVAGLRKLWTSCKDFRPSEAIPTCTACIPNAVSCMYADIFHTREHEHPRPTFKDASATQVCDNTKAEVYSSFGDLSKVVFGVSNLQRAIETMLIFLSGLLPKPVTGGHRPEINIVSALQEASVGTDAQTTLKSGQVPFDQNDFDRTEKYAKALEYFAQVGNKLPETLPFTFKASANKGNPLLNGAWGKLNKFASRMQEFCDWVTTTAKGKHGDEKKVFLLSGHSSWLKILFQRSLAHEEFKNLAETILVGGSGSGVKLKLGNASMIKFEMVLSTSPHSFWKSARNVCKITPSSTQLIYGKWQVKGACASDKKCDSLKQQIRTSTEWGTQVSGRDCGKPSFDL